MTAAITVLRVRRGQLKSQLTRFLIYVENLNQADNISRKEIKSRREKLEDVWQEFEQAQGAIEQSEENDEVAAAYRLEFENAYFRAIAFSDDIYESETNIHGG